MRLLPILSPVYIKPIYHISHEFSSYPHEKTPQHGIVSIVSPPRIGHLGMRPLQEVLHAVHLIGSRVLEPMADPTGGNTDQGRLGI